MLSVPQQVEDKINLAVR
jgi:hypothetical protein